MGAGADAKCNGMTSRTPLTKRSMSWRHVTPYTLCMWRTAARCAAHQARNQRRLCVHFAEADGLERLRELSADDLALFVGSDFLVTVHRAPVTLLEPLRNARNELRPDQVLYRVIDRVVESYIPLADRLKTNIERLEDEVVNAPRSAVLPNIGEARATLLELRRVLNATRHIVVQLRHVPGPLINQELFPFLRDVHDDLAIILDNIAAERDRLAGALDLYMSSIANRNAEATKTLTLLGTAALPGLVIASIFGMNIEYPSWVKSHSMFAIVMITSLAVTLFLLWYLRRKDYLPGGTTSGSTNN